MRQAEKTHLIFDLQLFADEAEAFNAWHAVAPYIRDKIDRF